MLARQPVARAQKKGPPGPAISYAVDAIHARLELAPAFSVAKGVYDADGGFGWAYRGAMTVKLDAESRLRPGDHFKLGMAWGPGDRLTFDADAREARGGAISGLMAWTRRSPST